MLFDLFLAQALCILPGLGNNSTYLDLELREDVVNELEHNKGCLLQNPGLILGHVVKDEFLYKQELVIDVGNCDERLPLGLLFVGV